MKGPFIAQGEIALKVKGDSKQSSNKDKLTCNIHERIADLSRFYHPQPGELNYTGTPEGVGEIALHIGAAE